MRCVEVVTGILNDPTKVDHTSAAVMRTMIDTRRILIRSESRYLQAVRILHKYAAGIQHSAGPVHGFVVKSCDSWHSSIEQDGEIWITPRLVPR